MDTLVITIISGVFLQFDSARFGSLPSKAASTCLFDKNNPPHPYHPQKVIFSMESASKDSLQAVAW